MKSKHLFPRAIRVGIAVLATALLSACTSTPKHTNVLIFGVNTKVALDVSQDPTSGVGVTLGYKRQEAVWMPLLPNQANGVPVDCKGGLDPCPKYVGNEGENKDTYSVLASFGMNFSGGGNATDKAANASGGIAQYFATGLAARELAKRGGAGLVNTNVNSALTAQELAAVTAGVKKAETELEELLALLADKADPSKVDKQKLDKAFATTPGKNIPVARQERLKTASSLSIIKRMLTGCDHDNVTLAMLNTLNAN